MTQIIFYSTAPLQVEKTLFALLEKSLEKGNKSLLLFKNKEKCLSINEQLWTYKQNSFLPHISASCVVTSKSNFSGFTNILFVSSN